MRKKRLFLIFMTFLLTFSFLWGEKFAFKYTEGAKYKWVTTVKEEVYANSQYQNSADIINKISIDVIDVKEDSGKLHGIFKTYERLSSGDSLYKEEDEVQESTYWRDKTGKYTDEKNQMMPLTRDLPLFPEKDLSPGDTWEAIGKEIYDFRDLGYPNPLHAPFKARYVYLRNEIKDNRQVAVIKAYYPILHNTFEHFGFSEVLPYKITGFSDKLIFWDIKRGRFHSYEDSFYILCLFINGDTFEFRGTSEGKLLEASDFDKDTVLDDIKKVIEEKGLKDTTVEKDDLGITIRMEDINFPPESDILLPSEQEKIKKIAEILKKYPDKDIFIGGHTALAGTAASRQSLSEKRAKSVGEFLLSLGVRKEDQMVYKGYGARLPLADNDTPDGRKRNRRVEIKILEN